MYDETKVVAKNTGMVEQRYISNEKLKDIVAVQPVVAGIVVTGAFKSYKSGIL